MNGGGEVLVARNPLRSSASWSEVSWITGDGARLEEVLSLVDSAWEVVSRDCSSLVELVLKKIRAALVGGVPVVASKMVVSRSGLVVGEGLMSEEVMVEAEEEQSLTGCITCQGSKESGY